MMAEDYLWSTKELKGIKRKPMTITQYNTSHYYTLGYS